MQEEKKQDNKGLVVIIIILLMLIAGLVAYILYDNNKAVKTNDKTTTVTTTTVSKEKIKEAYKSIIAKKASATTQEYIHSDFNYYGLSDIDKDGIKELIVRTGTCEADSVYEIYTYKDSSSLLLGKIGGGQTMLFESEDKYLISEYAHMGYESINHISIKNQTIVSKKISSRELTADEDYKTFDNPLNTKSFDDTSLIDNM